MKKSGTIKLVIAAFATLVLGGGIIGASVESARLNSSYAPSDQTYADENRLESDHLNVKQSAKAPATEKVSTVEHKDETKTEVIPYDTETRYDNSLAKGSSCVSVAGIEGVREIKYSVKYENEIEIGREKISEKISVKPVTKVVVYGTYEAPKTNTHHESSCGGDHYRNVNGNCVKGRLPIRKGQALDAKTGLIAIAKIDAELAADTEE